MNAPDWFYSKTPLFHITAIDNLKDIINSRALFSKNKVDKLNLKYGNIAHNHIQENRHSTILFNGYTLHDYIPLAFAPLSPMLNALHKGKIADCTYKQDDIVYLVTSANKLTNLKFIFTDVHPLSKPVNIYHRLNDLRNVDWEIFFEEPCITGKYAKFWLDKIVPDKPKWMDRKRKRMAEFLVYDSLPWNLIDILVVKNEAAKTKVETILKQFKDTKQVKVIEDWYY